MLTVEEHVAIPENEQEQYRQRTLGLMRQFGLSFTFNPGGGEFYREGFRQQVPTYYASQDYEQLREGLTRAGMLLDAHG